MSMKNKYLYLSIFIVFVSVLYSCKNIKEEEITILQDIDTVELKKSSTIDLNIDSIPFEFVSQTRIYNKKIYVSFSDVNFLINIHPDGKIERIDIPILAHNIFINENGLFFSGYLTPLMQYIDNGKMKKMNLPPKDDIGGHLRTYINDSIVYYFTNNKDKDYTISMYNMENKEMRYMGQFTSTLDSKDYRFGSSRHVVASENNLYTIGKIVPIIEKYDFNGTLIENYDLRRILVVSDWLDTKSLEKRLPYFSIFDCCIDGHYLYLSARDDKEVDDCRTILKFDIQDKITFDCQYLLCDSKKNVHFDVKGDSLISFDQISKTLNLYNLSGNNYKPQLNK